MPPTQNRMRQPCDGHEFRRDQTRQAAAERHAGEHQDDHGGARMLRREFVDQRHHDRQRAGERDAGQDAGEDKLIERGGRDRSQREQAKGEGAADDDALASETVGEIAEERRSEEAGGERTRQQNAEFGSAQAPFLDKSGPGKGRGAEIVAVGHHDQEGQDDEADIEAGDLLAV